MKILKKIVDFMKTRKLSILLLVGMVSLVVLPELAEAANTGTTAGVSNEKAEIERSIAFMFSLFVKTLNAFLWPFLIRLGDLMGNDLIFAPGVEDRLLSIWTQVRNLVNIVFAVVFLVVALYNVMGIGDGEGNFAIKTILPKLILGVVLVNFTFLGGRLLVDLSGIATTAAFALPEVTENFDFTEEQEKLEKNVCYREVSGEQVAYSGEDVPVFTKLLCQSDDSGNYSGKLKDSVKSAYFNTLNQNNIGLVMAINMGQLDKQLLADAESINDFGDLAINTIFSLVMYIVFAVSYIVLAIVLLTRIVVIWVALAVSPVAVLLYVIPQIRDALGGGGGDIANKVIKHIFAPAIIGFVLSIGYIVMSALEVTTGGGGLSAQGDLAADEFLLISGIDDLERLLIAMTSLVVVWFGIFAATSNTFAETLTGGIKNFGERIAGAAAKAPAFATFVPIATKDGDPVALSPMQLKNALDTGLQNIEYGRLGDQDRVNKVLEGRPFLQRLLTSGNPYDKNTPIQNGRVISDLINSKGSSNQYSKDELLAVAKSLRSLVTSSGLGATTKRALETQLQGIETQANQGNGRLAIEKLQTLLTNSDINDQNLNTGGTAISDLTARMGRATYQSSDENNNSSGEGNGAGENTGATTPTTPTVTGTLSSIPNIANLETNHQNIQIQEFVGKTKADIATELNNQGSQNGTTYDENNPVVEAIHQHIQNQTNN